MAAYIPPSILLYIVGIKLNSIIQIYVDILKVTVGHKIVFGS